MGEKLTPKERAESLHYKWGALQLAIDCVDTLISHEKEMCKYLTIDEHQSGWLELDDWVDVRKELIKRGGPKWPN